jgi:hypothetical protein
MINGALFFVGYLYVVVKMVVFKTTIETPLHELNNSKSSEKRKKKTQIKACILMSCTTTREFHLLSFK